MGARAQYLGRLVRRSTKRKNPKQTKKNVIIKNLHTHATYKIPSSECATRVGHQIRVKSESNQTTKQKHPNKKKPKSKVRKISINMKRSKISQQIHKNKKN